MKTTMRHSAACLLLLLSACSLAPQVIRAEENASFPNHVFHHICENDRLTALLRSHPLAIPQEKGATSPSQLCVVGDFGFQRARIYLELLASPNVDRVSLLTSPSPMFRASEAKMFLTITASDSQVVVEGPEGVRNIIPRYGGYEARLWLELDRDTLAISDARGQPRATCQFAVPGRLFLGIPAAQDSSATCSLLALDLYLDAAAAQNWFAACGKDAEEGRPWRER